MSFTFKHPYQFNIGYQTPVAYFCMEFTIHQTGTHLFSKVNVAIPDGWFPEFAKDKINCFVIPPASPLMTEHKQDESDANSMYDLLENEIIPMYYDNPEAWLAIVKNGMQDIIPQFDSNRMAKEYYEKLYLSE